MKLLFVLSILLLMAFQPSERERKLEFEGSMVSTTYAVDHKFYGKYQGSKQGYLLLNTDGTGVYNYDYKGLSKQCNSELIELKWGFLLDENKEIVRFDRPYGFSYPVIYNCSGENAFQGCTKRAMIDYILVYKNGTITVSSSDDWKKTQ